MSNEECSALKDILNQSMKLFLERSNQVGIEKALYKPYNFTSGFESTKQPYQTIWTKAVDTPNQFIDCNFSKSLFAYGPGSLGLCFKHFRNCNLSQSIWYMFAHHNNFFENCDFSRASMIFSNGHSNRFFGCNFLKTHFYSFYPYGENDYTGSNFSNAIMEFDDWMCIQKDQSIPDSNFTDTNLEGVKIIFSKGYTKIARSELKYFTKKMFNNDQLAKLNIDYKRLW